MKASILSVLAAAAAVQAGVVVSANNTLVTSTILTTQVYTVSKCPATVTNCPVGAVTSTVLTTTTVCPATAVYPPAPPPTHGPSTSTIYSTEVYTISSCAPTVTNCPYGKQTSSVHVSTVVYGTYTGTHTGTYTSYSPKQTGSTSPVATSKNAGVIPPPASSLPYCPTPITSYITVYATPGATTPVGKPAVSVYTSAAVVATTPAAVVASYGTAAPSAGKSYTTTTPVPFTGAASAQQAGGLLMAVGAVVAALL
ncbi:hypothetical protein G7Y89_g6744 [Cudoniella acicularis]|uniref:GPI anchored serine-rich protein n=1 Tax=Cudoniella acicularis TaxID=354080 RepID=A0A8H4RKP7_9HELO|nr:hypothetical protein G7Y89_g6744 [Cudoniella acicularis]